MAADVVFLDCPAYLDEWGTVRCGLPAEVEYAYTLRTSGGPAPGAKIRCPRGHWFNGLVALLILESSRIPGSRQGEGAGHAS